MYPDWAVGPVQLCATYYPKFLGAAALFKIEDLEAVNGFTNNCWGWVRNFFIYVLTVVKGAEDDELASRFDIIGMFT